MPALDGETRSPAAWASLGIEISYSALMAGVGESPKVAAGRYEFMPGEEMQHDTSPHNIRIGGRIN